MTITEIMVLVCISITVLTATSMYVSDKKTDAVDVLKNCICYNLAGETAVCVIYGVIQAVRWITENIVLFVLMLIAFLTVVVVFVCIVGSPYHEIRMLIRRKRREMRKWLRKVRRENEKYGIDYLHIAEKDCENILNTYDKLIELVPAYHLADPKNCSIMAIIGRLDETQRMIRKLWQQFLDLHASGISDLPAEVQDQIDALNDALNLLHRNTAAAKDNSPDQDSDTER